MSNIELDKEISAFYGEKKAIEESLFYEQQKFANAIKNGIGEELKKYLENPPQVKYQKSFKMKLKQWYNNLIKKLNYFIKF